ncbi:NAD-dependent epimerase/dehydratase family protein [Vreelandella utahensis]|uniref:NAD-dependent epimerase/dehydratase family protein n=1 Tax=Vreelandella halophila TaxID=86177 RepID=UPI0009866A00|nr:NAD-dependent epimerase/dehydratase family protein [Halomonas utahensis]
MRVLVTGSNGFTGGYLVNELTQAGHDVVGLGNGAGNDWQVPLEDREGLAAAVAAIEPDAVVHLAALAFVGHDDPGAFYQVNLMGTRNLLAALTAAPSSPAAVVLASSANVYGNQERECLGEDLCPRPANEYAVSKLAMEHMAATWADTLPVVITRPFNYTGVGQPEHFVIPRIVAHFRRREPVIELGNLDVWRDFSDVRAVAAAYRALVETPPVGETLNIASGESHSLHEVLALCREITGHDPQVRSSAGLARRHEVTRLRGDTRRLDACIGNRWQPPLRETLRWMLEA